MQTVSRLLTSFVPTNYKLSLELNRPQRTFHGTVTISGTLQPGVNGIIVHSKELTIESVLVDGKMAVATPGINDELTITQDNLTEGDHVVVIGYRGTITDAMHGLYPCYYDHAGVKKELLATQFESHHAREVFPCLDEPEAKATFDVTLTTEDEITVLGNMPIKSQDSDGRNLVTTFETTPRMSTYLLAFVAGELQKKTATTASGVEVNVFATPAQPESSLDFALGIATRTIEFYNDYFGTPYPLPKSDHVALPDFSSGAMENWGLITYREIALLADPATTGISSRRYVATVVAHELAHQWFGNLVTMKWWNDLWLNESFANMMEYLAVDSLHPEWNIWLEHATQESVMALRRDSIDGVQSVQVDVHHPDEINTLFDGAIVYAKGGRLLRMLQHYVGNEAFQAGLKQYFKDHAYGNTEGNDLWSAIAAASGKDIVGLMNTWISQPGYPVVHVSRDGGQVTLRQEQFFVGPHADSDRLWPIPLNSSDRNAPAMLYSAEATFSSSQSPLRFNVGDSAHFITHYDDDLLAELVTAVRAGNLSPLDRIQLLDEATLLARGGYMPSANLINLLGAFTKEANESVWNTMSIALGELRKFTDDNPAAEKKLRTLSADLARAQYQRLGWTQAEGESEEDTQLRSTIIALMVYGEDPEALQTAQTLYETTAVEDLNPELRPIILSSVARQGDETVVDALLAEYQMTQNSDLKNDICAGITSTRVPAAIMKLLDGIKDSKVVRPQDAGRWFVYLVRGKDSREYAWQWIQDNWQWVIDTFSGDKSYDDYPRYSASALVTPQQLQEYRDFFGPMKDIPALSRVITMGISEIEGRVELIERDKTAVQQALLAL